SPKPSEYDFARDWFHVSLHPCDCGMDCAAQKNREASRLAPGVEDFPDSRIRMPHVWYRLFCSAVCNQQARKTPLCTCRRRSGCFCCRVLVVVRTWSLVPRTSIGRGLAAGKFT